MLKKIFIAATLAVLMLSSQIAAAEIPIDWSKVKQVSSKSALRAYLEEANRNGETIVPVILTNGLTLRESELLDLSSSSMIHYEVKGSNAQNIWLILTLQEYPGTRVANAYLNKNTAWLSQDELELYNIASKIADKINKEKYLEDRAMSIYQEIMNRVEYLTGDMSNQPRFITAIGALVDGKANCQGYADAFYMLGRMCNLNVGRMSGTADGTPHMWNTINYGGNTYFIDATWGDSLLKKSKDGKRAHSYIYFNAPVEIMQVTHKWDPSTAPPNLQPDVDYEYSYVKFWRGNLARATSAEGGLQLLANELNDGKHSWFSVMTPYDEKFDHDHVQQVSNYLGKLLNKESYVYVYTYGRYIFFSVYLL